MSRRFMFNCLAAVCGAALALLAGGVGEVRAGDEVHEVQKLTVSDAAAWDEFGTSVSVSGDTAMVGAVWDDRAAGDHCGAAYVFSLAVTPTRSDPPDYSIDARQPSDLACTELFGCDSIDVIYNGDTAGVQASDFTVAAARRVGAPVLEASLLFRLTPEDLVVAVAVEWRIDVDQVHAAIGQPGELVQAITAADDARVERRGRSASGGAGGSLAGRPRPPARSPTSSATVNRGRPRGPRFPDRSNPSYRRCAIPRR